MEVREGRNAWPRAPAFAKVKPAWRRQPPRPQPQQGRGDGCEDAIARGDHDLAETLRDALLPNRLEQSKIGTVWAGLGPPPNLTPRNPAFFREVTAGAQEVISRLD